jgi:5-methylcytosine-specific restriction endonuclease McrA
MKEIVTKFCYKCKKEKGLLYFHFRVSTGYYKSPCKYCVSLRGSEYRNKHKEKIRKYNQKRRKTHKEEIKAQKQRRRALKNNCGDKFTGKEWVDVCNKYKNRCLCCNKRKPLTADHVIPLSRGGTNGIDNIQPLCRSCNSRKGTKTMDYRNG